MTFEELRKANVKRCGESFHPLHDWSPTDWGCAMGGECGEALNKIKKLRRLGANTLLAENHIGRDSLIQEIADEIADVVIYADLLCERLNINLHDAIVRKFNIVSDRVASTTKLE